MNAGRRRADLRIALSEACRLLKMAKCPNANCVDGGYPHNYCGDMSRIQCEWCHEKKLLIDEHG